MTVTGDTAHADYYATGGRLRVDPAAGRLVFEYPPLPPEWDTRFTYRLAGDELELVQGWKKQMLEGAATVFTRTDKAVSSKEVEAKQAELFEQIGRLKRELEWLKKSQRPSCDGKRRQVAPKHAELSIRRPPGNQYAYFLPVAGT